MAATQEPTVPTVSLRVLVDKEKHRVVLAEANKDFVDILFSFLTLPMGTIIRLVGKQQSSEHAKLGCMNNLYRSVENLSTDALWTDTCKLMLLRPINIWATHCRNLKVNVDDSEPTKCFICSDIQCSRRIRCGLLSNYMNARCRCGNLMNREIGFKDSDVNADRGNGEVFIKGATHFIISDDLQVMTSSPGTSLKLLSILGIIDMYQFDELTLNVGFNEIINLLKHSLLFKSPLTDAFLPKQGFISSTREDFDPQYSYLSQNKTETAATSEKMTVKVIIRKSDNKTLYAEAREDFVDFLFSFLTIPLGSVVKLLLGGESTLGCIDNLYKSVECLNSEWFVQLEPKTLRVVLESAKYELFNSRLAPQYSCFNQLLNIHGEESLQYYSYSKGEVRPAKYVKGRGKGKGKGKKVELRPSSYYLTTHVQSVNSNLGEVLSPLTLIDPMTPAGENSFTGGFVSGPAMFLVMDDLVVTPFSFCSISFLKTFEIPIDDLEERVINIGKAEALSLLKATLISTSALTKGTSF